MSSRSARRQFVSVWMLEFSVLWAVFLLLDQLLSGQVSVRSLSLAFLFVVSSFLAGVVLAGEEESWTERSRPD